MPSGGARTLTPEQIAARNATLAAGRAKRDEMRKLRASGQPVPDTSQPSLPLQPEFDVQEPPPAPAPSAFGGILDSIRSFAGGDEKPAPSPKKAPTKADQALQADFAGQIVPLGALFITWSAASLITGDYQPIAPTFEESTALMTPIANIISRQLHVRGKISPDTMDALNIILALGMYGQRAFGDYQRIKKDREVTNNGNRPSGTAGGLTGGYSAPAAPSNLADNARNVTASNRQAATNSTDRHEAVGKGDARRDTGGPRLDDNPIAGFLAADAEWRRQQGLV